jgi:hypothetical protein
VCGNARDKESNMKAVVLAVTGLALVLAGCSSSYDNNYPMGLPEDTLTCPDDPPQVCTQDYRPVFGYDYQGGILGEYSNACVACATYGVAYTSQKSDPNMPGPVSSPTTPGKGGVAPAAPSRY